MQGLGFGDGAEMLSSFESRVSELSTLYRDALNREIKRHPMNVAAKGVMRMNGVRLFRLLYYIDWAACDSPASLWRFTGMGVTDGRSDYQYMLSRGGITWSRGAFRATADLKRQIIRNGSLYQPIWKQRKLMEEQEKYHRPHFAHRRAMRYVMKMWLKHLWIVSRSVYNLPDNGRHEFDRSPGPKEFGWVIPGNN